MFGKRLGSQGGGVEQRGLTAPRRGAREEDLCRPKRFSRSQVPLTEGHCEVTRNRAQRGRFAVSKDLLHPLRPLFSLHPTTLEWGAFHSLCQLEEKVCTRLSIPRGRQPGADGREPRGGGALGTQSWGAACRAPPASPAQKSQRARAYERSLKTGREGRGRLHIRIQFMLFMYILLGATCTQ